MNSVQSKIQAVARRGVDGPPPRLLGNVALGTGVRLDWDPQNLRATNTSDADRFIRRDYRPGWKLI